MVEIIKIGVTAVVSSGFGTLAGRLFEAVVPAATLTKYGKVAVWTTTTATGLALARATKPATDEYIDTVADSINGIRSLRSK